MKACVRKTCVRKKGKNHMCCTTAKYIKKFKVFVQKWVQRFEGSKNVDNLSDRGSIVKVTKKDKTWIAALFLQNPRLSLRGQI